VVAVLPVADVEVELVLEPPAPEVIAGP